MIRYSSKWDQGEDPKFISGETLNITRAHRCIFNMLSNIQTYVHEIERDATFSVTTNSHQYAAQRTLVRATGLETYGQLPHRLGCSPAI